MNKKMTKYVLKGNTMTKIGGDTFTADDEYDFTDREIVVGAASDLEDFNMGEDDFSNFNITADDIAAAEKKAAVNIERVVDFTYKDIGKGVELVEDHYIYPEDNMFQLKEKIFLLTGIPIYRQHLFYQISGVNFTSYRIKLDGEISNQIVEYDQFPDKVVGLHYDRFMVDHKESLLEAYFVNVYRASWPQTFQKAKPQIAQNNVVSLEAFRSKRHMAKLAMCVGFFH
jgi:hypothetical protein